MAHAAAHIDENLYAYRSLITLGALLPVAYHARRTWQHTLRRYTCASQLRRREPVLMGNQQQQLQLQQQQAEHAVAFRGRVTGLGWWGNNSNSGNDGGCSGAAQRVLCVHHMTSARRLLLSGDAAALSDASHALLLRPFGLDLGDDGLGLAIGDEKGQGHDCQRGEGEGEGEAAVAVAAAAQREFVLRTRVRDTAAQWVERQLLDGGQQRGGALVDVQVLALDGQRRAHNTCSGGTSRTKTKVAAMGLCALEYRPPHRWLPWRGRRRDVAMDMLAAGAARVRDEPSIRPVPQRSDTDGGNNGGGNNGSDSGSHGATRTADKHLPVAALQLLVERMEHMEHAQAQAQAAGLGIWEGDLWKTKGVAKTSAREVLGGALESLGDAALERVLPPVIQKLGNWKHNRRRNKSGKEDFD